MAHDVGAGSFIKFGAIFGSNPGTHYRVTGLNWGGVERDESTDVSHLLSVAKEFIGSPVYDPGEVGVEVQFDPSLNFIALMKSAATNQVVELSFANGAGTLKKWTAFGQLTKFDIGATRDELMTGTMTIKLSGEVGTAA